MVRISSHPAMPAMLLIGQSKVFKHGKAKTLYVSIPSKVAEDSAFTIKQGDMVEVKFDKELNAVVIRSKTTSKEHRIA